jgi:hypothetical protein
VFRNICRLKSSLRKERKMEDIIHAEIAKDWTFIFDWRKLHNEDLHNPYDLPNILRMIKSRGMKWAGHVARMGANMNSHGILVGKPEEQRPLGRPRRR